MTTIRKHDFIWLGGSGFGHRGPGWYGWVQLSDNPLTIIVHGPSATLGEVKGKVMKEMKEKEETKDE